MESSENDKNDNAPGSPATATEWLHDWNTIWRTELAAMAVDREMLEGMSAAAQSWATVAALMQGATHGQSREAGTSDRTTGAAPAVAASGSGGDAGTRDDIERLTQRVAELERRLDQRDARPGGEIGTQPLKPARRPRPGKPLA